MSKLINKIELLSWLRFKTYNLPVARFCKDVLGDFSMYLAFMMAGLFTLSAFTQNVTDMWFKSSSIAAATLWLIFAFVRTLFIVAKLNQTDGIKNVVLHVLRVAVSSALILYSGSNMTMDSSSLTFGLAAMSYIIIVVFIKIVESLDKHIQTRLYDFSHLLDNLSELKTEDVIAEEYRSYDFKIVRQSRSNIIYDLGSFGQRENYIKYELDLIVHDHKLKTDYFLAPVIRLT